MWKITLTAFTTSAPPTHTLLGLHSSAMVVCQPGHKSKDQQGKVILQLDGSPIYCGQAVAWTACPLADREQQRTAVRPGDGQAVQATWTVRGLTGRPSRRPVVCAPSTARGRAARPRDRRAVQSTEWPSARCAQSTDFIQAVDDAVSIRDGL
jgi:hypothetical protein